MSCEAEAIIMRAEKARDFLIAQGEDRDKAAALTSTADDYQLVFGGDSGTKDIQVRPLESLPSKKFIDFLSRTAGRTLSRQYAFADWLRGNRSGRVDLAGCAVDFGQNGVLPAQMIGSANADSNTWLWGWHNPEVPKRSVQKAEWLREEWGEQLEIEEFRRYVFSLRNLNGWHVSLAACACFENSAFYCCEYRAGLTVYLLLQPPPSIFQPADPVRISKIIEEMIRMGSLHHRVMVRSFLESEGFELDMSEPAWRCAASDGRRVICTFDKMGRLVDYEALLN